MRGAISSSCQQKGETTLNFNCYFNEIKCMSRSFARVLGLDNSSSTANEHATLTAARLDDSDA